MLSSLVTSVTLALAQSSSTLAPVMPSPLPQPSPFSVIAQAAARDGAEAAKDPAAVVDAADANGNGGTPDQEKVGFVRGIFKAYKEAFFPDPNAPPEEEPKRRTLPQPWSAPPFPGHEYQGYPLIGVPPDSVSNPLMQGLFNTPFGDTVKKSKLQLEGWVTGSYNWSQDKNSNLPTSYWLVPNRLELDQFVLRLSRQLDSVQTDHIDWGFRSTIVYGIDYRFLSAGGWGSDYQYQVRNQLYGWDPTEQYFDVYFPGVMSGMIVRVGRWIACPDIETQFAPDNYLASHSLLFTYDAYTQTGIMLTFKGASDQWLYQIGLNAGDDMAPWYKGANLSGFVGVRWVAQDNRDAAYVCLNQINGAQFRHFDIDNQPAGHDNYNYVVGTWEHKFNDSGSFHTKTEGYFMWQRNAELGGTPSIGPVQSFGGGGGDGTLLPGISYAYGVLNYSMLALNKKDYVTVRNEYWRDERGMRSGFPGTYTSHTIGLCHNFNSVLQVRPEIGYYRNWTNPAFDLGTRNGMWMAGLDFTLRF